MALQYVGTLSQGDVTGKEKMYVASSSGVIGPGDAVRITGTADADGIATVDLGPANTGSTGVVSSILPIFSGESLSTTWAPASTAVYLLVNCDPMAQVVCTYLGEKPCILESKVMSSPWSFSFARPKPSSCTSSS